MKHLDKKDHLIIIFLGFLGIFITGYWCWKWCYMPLDYHECATIIQQYGGACVNQCFPECAGLKHTPDIASDAALVPSLEVRDELVQSHAVNPSHKEDGGASQGLCHSAAISQEKINRSIHVAHVTSSTKKAQGRRIQVVRKREVTATSVPSCSVSGYLVDASTGAPDTASDLVSESPAVHDVQSDMQAVVPGDLCVGAHAYIQKEIIPFVNRHESCMSQLADLCAIITYDKQILEGLHAASLKGYALQKIVTKKNKCIDALSNATVQLYEKFWSYVPVPVSACGQHPLVWVATASSEERADFVGCVHHECVAVLHAIQKMVP